MHNRTRAAQLRNWPCTISVCFRFADLTKQVVGQLIDTEVIRIGG